MNRRDFLRLELAGLLAALLAGPVRVLAGGEPRLLSCHSDGRGGHFASLFDLGGRVSMTVRLPGRGHAISVHPNGTEAVVFARRPGDFLWVLDLEQGRVSRRIRSAPDRHYYGHGVFDRSGARLYVTENDFESGEGRIGIYAVDQGYRRLGELPSHGVGPHQLQLLSDGRTLVVANGGIRSHPDLPRARLNLDAMDPNLAYIDSADGRLRGACRPPEKWYRLSIRHIDVSADDRVAIAMQYQGPGAERPPLLALHRGDSELKFLRAPDEVQGQMRNYCGSVVFAADGRRFAVSSPRGNLITYWGSAGDFLGHDRQNDACGLVALGGGFWASDGLGRLVQRVGRRPEGGSPAETPVERVFAGHHWDNHLTRL